VVHPLWRGHQGRGVGQHQDFIIAEPNGAGKTTLARDFLPAEAQTLRFINADLIKMREQEQHQSQH